MRTFLKQVKVVAFFVLCISLLALSSCQNKVKIKSIQEENIKNPLDITQKPFDANLNWKKIIGHYQKMEGKPEESFLIREDNSKLLLQYKEKDYELIQNTFKEYTCKAVNPLKIGTLFFLIDKKGYTPLCKVNDVFYERKTFEQKTFDFAYYTQKQTNIKKDDSDFVNVKEIDPTLTIFLRFSPKQNAYLKKEHALALKNVNASLAKFGYSLIVLDAYRSFSIPGLADQTEDFKTGSTVAVTLFNAKSQETVDFGSSYLEFSERSQASYQGGTSLERWHRQFLRTAMKNAGFKETKSVWWKFTR
jgi:D-alanyl-D-alanine dipeptidase